MLTTHLFVYAHVLILDLYKFVRNIAGVNVT